MLPPPCCIVSATLPDTTPPRSCSAPPWPRRDLMGIAPPVHRRLITGCPHLAVEFWLAGGEDISVRIWIPGPVAHGRVENAVRTAWPGALILTEHTDPALPAGAVTGGRVR